MNNIRLTKHHYWYYIGLLVILVATVFTISFFGYNKALQITILVFTALFYVILGISHHVIHHTITLRIVIEYVAMASLGISIIFFVLQGL